MSRPVRWISLALACALALPIPLGIFANLHLWLSPNLLLQALLARGHFVLFNILGIAAILLVLWRERWFCRNACPTGALCDAAAACRKKGPSWEKVPFVNRWVAIFGLAAAACGLPLLAMADPVVLFTGAWGVLRTGATLAGGLALLGLAAVLGLNLCFPRLWCARLCPLGGLQVLLWDLRRALRRGTPAPPAGPVLSRRNLLAAVSGAGTGLLTRKAVGAGERSAVRPPASLAEGIFKTTCCRCGTCARVCPTRIIRSSTDVRDPLGLLSPRLDFSRAYCLPSCDACGKSCPTGAIAPFKASRKDRLVLGKAEVRLDDCLAVNGKECDRCVAACPYQAIHIAGGGLDVAPEVSASRCVGCGACQAICPPAVISIRPA